MWSRDVLRGAVDFLYPPACRLCDCELPDRTNVAGVEFCSKCQQELSADGQRACMRCGASIGPGLDPNLPCGMCHDERFAFDRVIRLGVYDGALRQACLAAKPTGAEPLAAALAELTWQTETAAFHAAQVDLVVPVPQFWIQRLTRRHHAADTLAQVWGTRLKVPVAPHILRKVRWTQPQARLTPSQRRTNLRRAFTAEKDSLAGATVLLADDVMTTGTTAHEAARQLRRAGATRVIVAVVARGLGRR